MIVAHVGLPGSGKTYSMAEYLLSAQKDMRATFANFPVQGARGFYDLQQIFGVRKGLIAVDELHLVCPSRYRIPTEYAQVWSQSRHLGIDMHYTTQNFKRAHNTIRDITNYVWYYKRIFGRWHRAYLFDGASYEQGRHKRPLRIRDFILSAKVWSKYDTTHLVKPADHLNVKGLFDSFQDPMDLPIFNQPSFDNLTYEKSSSTEVAPLDKDGEGANANDGNGLFEQKNSGSL